MSIELRVRGRMQRSRNACWWECIAMVLEYYGRHYAHPGQLHSQFVRPWNRLLSPVPDLRLPTIDEAMVYDPTLRRASDLQFSEPYEWYERGLPPTRQAFSLLGEMTRFRGFARPAFGSWTANDVESRLRRYGPYVFFGSWNNAPHAIVTVGLIQQGTGAIVVTIDPIRGFATSEPLPSFNARMAQQLRRFNFDQLNPMYLPQDNPIRAVVDHG